MDPQNVEYSSKTNDPQCWYGAEKILKSPSVRALQRIWKFCENKGVCWYFSTYGVFYSLIKKKKIGLCVCVFRSLSHAVGFVWAVWKISKSEICSDFIFGLNRNRVLFRPFLAWTLLSRAQNRFVATILRVDRQIDLLLVCLLCLSHNALYSDFRADFVWIELYKLPCTIGNLES